MNVTSVRNDRSIWRNGERGEGGAWEAGNMSPKITVYNPGLYSLYC